jgi:hypothetical protein
MWGRRHAAALPEGAGGAGASRVCDLCCACLGLLGTVMGEWGGGGEMQVSCGMWVVRKVCTCGMRRQRSVGVVCIIIVPGPAG